MTITVDIAPEVQAELARQAAAQGRAVEEYAAGLLEGAVYFLADADYKRSQDRLADAMPEFSHKVPILPD